MERTIVRSFPTVPEDHKHRVTTPEKSRRIPHTPTALQNPRRDPRRVLWEANFLGEPPQRVVPLGWWPSGTLESFLSMFYWGWACQFSSISTDCIAYASSQNNFFCACKAALCFPWSLWNGWGLMFCLFLVNYATKMALTLGVVPINQSNRCAIRENGVLSEIRVFPPEKQGEFTQIGELHKHDFFCANILVFPGKHPEFRKVPIFANRLTNRPCFGLVCLEHLW